jgi:hypothetical protein
LATDAENDIFKDLDDPWFTDFSRAFEPQPGMEPIDLDGWEFVA